MAPPAERRWQFARRPPSAAVAACARNPMMLIALVAVLLLHRPLLAHGRPRRRRWQRGAGRSQPDRREQGSSARPSGSTSGSGGGFLGRGAVLCSQRTGADRQPHRQRRRRQKWLIMLYQDADDRILEKDIFIDLNEAELVGSNDQVQVVSQIDRYRGGFDGDGDWNGAALLRDAGQRPGAHPLAGSGGPGRGQHGQRRHALVDFVKWAVSNYPADKYVLILSDHGMGWPGGWSDRRPAVTAAAMMPRTHCPGAGQPDVYSPDRRCAGRAAPRTGIDKFELVGMDACLMGHLEVLKALSNMPATPCSRRRRSRRWAGPMPAS